MKKEFGRVQKAILSVMALASMTSTVMCAVGLLDGSQWVMFNLGLLGGGIAALSGGKAANTWASKSNGGGADVDEA